LEPYRRAPGGVGANETAARVTATATKRRDGDGDD
jgi:hypothetical protein